MGTAFEARSVGEKVFGGKEAMDAQQAKGQQRQTIKNGREPKKRFDIHVSLHRYERETAVCLRRRFEQAA